MRQDHRLSDGAVPAGLRDPEVRVLHGVSRDGREVLEQLPVIAYRCLADQLWTCTWVGADVATLGFPASRWTRDGGLWLRQVHPDDRERVVVERRRALTTGTMVVDYRIRTASGEERWVHDRAQVRTDEGGPALVHGVLVDMTERHDAERAIEQSFETAARHADVLARAQAVETAFLQLFSHDVRSPLSAVSGILDTLLDEAAQERLDADMRRTLLQRARSAVGRVQVLVGELNDGLAAEAPDTAMTRTVDLCGMVRDVVAELEVDPARVEVSCEEVTVVAVASLLRRALVGLVGNALTHTAPGTIVTVTAVATDEGVVVVVEDDGPGIPDEDKERVFDPFVKLADGASGLGLGLHLVQEVAHLHGGQVWVEDGVAGGAVFSLFLPDQAAAATG
jgi:signal transduction histidine kinase